MRDRLKVSPYSKVDHADIGRMHFKGFALRHVKFVPPWAASDAKVRLVVYNYLFRYCQLLGMGPYNKREIAAGTSLMDLEKLATKVRTEFCARRNGVPFGEALQQKMNEHSRIASKGIAATRTAMIYMAYRQRLLAKDIAAEFEMTAVTVRQTLLRLNIIARRLFPDDCSTRPHWIKPAKPRRSFVRTFPLGPHDHDLLSRVAVRFKAGETLKVLAREVSYPYFTLRYRLQKYGFYTANPHWSIGLRPPVTYDLKLLQTISTRYKAGEKITNLAREIGWPEGTLRGRLIRNSLHSSRPYRVKHV